MRPLHSGDGLKYTMQFFSRQELVDGKKGAMKKSSLARALELC